MAKKTYQQKKAEARDEAINWQLEISTKPYLMYYSELAFWGNHFEKSARRYGLVREFKENGII